jgi:hypothetical protein
MTSPHKYGGAPQAIDAEKAIIGAILITGSIPKGITRDLFIHPDLVQYFDWMQENAAHGLGVDLTSILPRVLDAKKDVSLFVALPGACPSIEAVPHWVRLLRQKLKERRMYWWSRDISEAIAVHDYERVAALQKSPPVAEEEQAVEPVANVATSNGPDRDVLREVKRQTKRKAAQSTIADYVLRNDPAWSGKLWWDDYRKQTMVGGGQVADADFQRINLWLDRTYRVKVAPASVAGLVEAIAKDNARNPLQMYLRGLKWDGVARLSGWLMSGLGVADTPLHQMIGRRWMVQAVARALRPGCKADVVLVLTGKQGIRKSSALRELAGVEYFSDSPIPIGEGPRAMSQVYSAWLHELSELASLRGKAVEDVKSFITKTHDDFQPLYSRTQVHWARFSVFAGTTNEDYFLSDPTGARRFWPVRALKVDLDWIKQNRDQLWAEAVAALEAGECWWLDADEEKVVEEDREQYQREETWDDLVLAWLASQPRNMIDSHDFDSALTAARLLKMALGIDPHQHTTGNITRIGQVMKRLGYVKTRPTLSNQRVWVYVPEKQVS